MGQERAGRVKRATRTPRVVVRAARGAEQLDGAPGGIRTPDPQIRSLPLYPLSYGRVLLEDECY